MIAHSKKIKIRKPLRVFYDVQKALFLRELSMRFSTGRTGLFWTFMEPFIQIFIFVLIKVALFGSKNETFDFAVFLAINFTFFNLFKNIVGKSINAFSANKALFVYKQIKPIDTIIARGLVEIFITIIIVMIFILIGYYFDYDMHINDFNTFFLGVILLIIFSYSFAIFASVGNIFIQSVGKVVGFLMRFAMFASAVFYTLDTLPQNFRDILLLNPLTHLMEAIHGNYFIGLSDKYVSYSYITFWILVLLYVGLWLYIKLEKRIISQ